MQKLEIYQWGAALIKIRTCNTAKCRKVVQRGHWSSEEELSEAG
jgi:hypothetical protein